MKVLLTGSTGFLGQYVLQEIEKNFDVIVACSNKKKLKDIKYKKVYFNINEKKSYSSILKIKKIDYIIHLASKIGWTGEKYEDMYQANVLSVKFLVNIAKTHNAKIIFSSAALIHGVSNEKINSRSKVEVSSSYMKTKYDAEQVIINSSANFCILRIAGIFGLNGPSHLGLNKTIASAIRNEPPDLGKNLLGLRNYIYVKDVARVIKYVIDNRVTGTHLVAGNEKITIRDMISKIYKKFYPEYIIKYKQHLLKSDQIIVHSKSIIKSRSFNQALDDIKNIISS